MSNSRIFNVHNILYRVTGLQTLLNGGTTVTNTPLTPGRRCDASTIKRLRGSHMEDEKQETNAEDPFIETEKRLLQLEKQVETLNKALTDKEKMMNAVIKTTKQLLTELNNVPQKPEAKPINKDKIMEESFFKHLGIKQA